jgi:polyisoprenoid-binding protein YceI
MNRSILTITTAVLALLVSPLTAQTHELELHQIDTSHSDVSFEVRHLVSKVRGNFGQFEGTIYLNPEVLEQSRVEFSVTAESINTNLEARDKHLKGEDFFWVEKYPQIRFKSSKIETVGAASDNLFNVTGTLSLRGVEKELVLPVSYLGQVDDPWGNRKGGFSTEITLNRKDFNMVWNAALDKGGVVLGDDVKLNIDLETVRAKPDDESDEDA